MEWGPGNELVTSDRKLGGKKTLFRELVSSSNLGGLIIVITQLIVIVTNYHEPPSSFGVSPPENKNGDCWNKIM